MKTMNIHAAKTHFSSLVAEVEAGEEIIIAKAGKPVARLMPLQKKRFPPLIRRAERPHPHEG